MTMNFVGLVANGGICGNVYVASTRRTSRSVTLGTTDHLGRHTGGGSLVTAALLRTALADHPP